MAPDHVKRIDLPNGEYTEDTINIYRATEALLVLGRSLKDKEGHRFAPEVDPDTARRHVTAFLEETVAENRGHA